MPAYNFKTKFAYVVQSGQKRQTIRRRRKHRPTVIGDQLQLYVGQRTDNCRLLRKAFCTAVRPVEVHEDYVCVNGRTLSPSEAEKLANEDGFATTDEMIDFFRRIYKLPFLDAELICW